MIRPTNRSMPVHSPPPTTWNQSSAHSQFACYGDDEADEDGGDQRAGPAAARWRTRERRAAVVPEHGPSPRCPSWSQPWIPLDHAPRPATRRTDARYRDRLTRR